MANSEWRIGDLHALLAPHYPLLTIHHPLFATRAFLPLFPERADFQLKAPGAARLLVKLPVRGCDRRRRHQQIRIVERFLAPELLAAFAHPGGIRLILRRRISSQSRHRYSRRRRSLRRSHFASAFLRSPSGLSSLSARNDG